MANVRFNVNVILYKYVKYRFSPLGFRETPQSPSFKSLAWTNYWFRISHFSSFPKRTRYRNKSPCSRWMMLRTGMKMLLLVSIPSFDQYQQWLMISAVLALGSRKKDERFVRTVLWVQPTAESSLAEITSEVTSRAILAYHWIQNQHKNLSHVQWMTQTISWFFHLPCPHLLYINLTRIPDILLIN